MTRKRPAGALSKAYAGRMISFACGGCAGAPPAGARDAVAAGAHLCAKRHDGVLPKLVRDFFLSFLAAQYAGVDFDDFRDAMEGREETKAFFAWRRACAARSR
jgi:hypothetical protein